MDVTLFLAGLWGPLLLAFGAGLFAARPFYRAVYRDFAEYPVAVLTLGMVMLVAGIAHTLFHTVWETPLQSIVTILGWATLSKGALFLVVPQEIGVVAKYWVRAKLIPYAAVAVLILGVYLSFFAYIV